MAKTKIPHVLLLIDRDASTKIPVMVPEYEQTILEEIYGEDLVHEVEGQGKDLEIEDFDVQKAFDGLVSKYQSTAEGDLARKQLYPKVRDLDKRLKALGVKVASKDDDGGDDSLASGTVAQITASLSGLSDEELDQLAEDEAAGKDRAGVHSAIEAEREKRTGNQ
ncbi:MAG TPA: hypothetical protein DEB32_02730 [Stenotrophomonas sp.]|uniref:Uncharacterized protein n=1 Tax=Stenotrophomonas maltophilia TaxID=40324 RepID=A0A4S2D2Z8_STEMA|nr:MULTISPECIES: hypothetical protein [Stenotrophomonas]TGY35251.1 hypothetical protein E5352_05895 [Stenotrophomonas maltophilia]HBS61647.1 hypothetical protein [Stenotrophomonas sp.]